RSAPSARGLPGGRGGCAASGPCGARRRTRTASGRWSSSQLQKEAGQIVVREVVPAVAAVVLRLLHVAGGGQAVHFLAGHLPAVGDLLQIGAGDVGVAAGDPAVAPAQLGVRVAVEAPAED